MAVRSDVRADHAVAPAPPRWSTIDPRLVLHPHRVALAGVLTDAGRLSGSLTPDLPGANAIVLVLGSPPGPGPSTGPSLHLTAMMPGMHMAPLRATLGRRGGRFTGTLTLPMFGTYRVAVATARAAATATGVLTVTIPLPPL
jgi:hypothetical protein